MDEKNREKIVSYPAYSLEEAVGFSKELLDKMGVGPFSRDAIATALGHPSINNGAAIRKVACLVHFGLIQRDGGKYFISDTAKKILMPVDEKGSLESLRVALSTPTLYAKLVSQYENKSLPLMLENVLVHNFGITLKTSKSIARDFKSSLEYAEMLKNGVVLLDDNSVQNIELQENENGRYKENNVIAKETCDPSMSELKLPSGIIIKYPQELSYDFAMGEFSAAIKDLNDLADRLMKEKNIS